MQVADEGGLMRQHCLPSTPRKVAPHAKQAVKGKSDQAIKGKNEVQATVGTVQPTRQPAAKPESAQAAKALCGQRYNSCAV